MTQKYGSSVALESTDIFLEVVWPLGIIGKGTAPGGTAPLVLQACLPAKGGCPLDPDAKAGPGLMDVCCAFLCREVTIWMDYP